MRSKRLRNIHRRDSGYNRGWYVLVQRGSVVHKKSFADGAHGGKRQALLVAIGYRDVLLKRIRPPYKLHRSNVLCTTGVVGVELLQERLRDGTLCERYRALLVDPSGRKRRSFSVKKYGRREALRLAILAREGNLAHLLACYADLPGSVVRRRYGAEATPGHARGPSISTGSRVRRSS